MRGISHQVQGKARMRSRSAIFTLAKLAAKKAVKEQLRNEGRRMTLVCPAEITAKANEYLTLHPELFDEARERAHLSVYAAFVPNMQADAAAGVDTWLRQALAEKVGGKSVAIRPFQANR
ncbi:MAG: hypothetical protein WAK55_19405 [Xanthobacteraceae bacterium]